MSNAAAARFFLRNDFRTFLETAFRYLNPAEAGFTLAWHHYAIAHRLSLVKEGSLKRLMVTIPPRQLKSTIISVAWPAWMLGHNPALRFVTVSLAEDLAMKHARDCRKILQSSWYRAVFPEVGLTRFAENDIETTSHGGRFSTTVGGTLTGRGGDIIIIDDPIKPEDANSDTARNAVNSWYQSTLLSRLNSQEKGAIVLVMQRLHQDDLAGYLLEQGGWDELRLPAIADAVEEVPIGPKEMHRRNVGDLLDPDRFSAETLAERRRNFGSMAFAAQYQQSPVPAEGNLIRRQWIRRYEDVERRPGDQIVQSWDTATKTGLGNDWSVCITALIRREEIYIIDVFRERLEFPDLRRKVIALAERHRPHILLIEDAASGQQLIQQLKSERPPGVPRPLARKPASDKQSRVFASSAPIENGTVLFPNEAAWLAGLEGELLGFPNARHDDQVDALTQLLDWFLSRPRSPFAFDGEIVGGVVIRADDPDIPYVEEDESDDGNDDDYTDELDEGLGPYGY